MTHVAILPERLESGDKIVLDGSIMRVVSVSYIDDEIGYHVEFDDGTAAALPPNREVLTGRQHPDQPERVQKLVDREACTQCGASTYNVASGVVRCLHHHERYKT